MLCVVLTDNNIIEPSPSPIVIPIAVPMTPPPDDIPHKGVEDVVILPRPAHPVIEDDKLIPYHFLPEFKPFIGLELNHPYYPDTFPEDIQCFFHKCLQALHYQPETLCDISLFEIDI